MSKDKNVLDLQQLAISNGDAELVKLSARVNAGEVLTVMGPSGSGKSTLLQAIAGQLSAPFDFTGRILLSGEDITHKPAHRRHIGVMFQDALLFEHMTVEENIAFAMPKGRFANKQARINAIEVMLETVELNGMQKRSVSALSGGQQARVSLLRTLSSQPKAVLLDEPFSKLDASLREHIRTWTFEQLNIHNIPAVLVTHDKEDAIAAGGEIIELSKC
ncbi:MAG: ATP-binding cassette domain-containing protein [Pseudomonadota bacterium]|nr:ATP-binding cassette domain-containing protein [Pseudomonadota bacterium]